MATVTVPEGQSPREPWLPQTLDPVRVQCLVLAEDTNPLTRRLCDEQSVKRVPMVLWQLRNNVEMWRLDTQYLNRVPLDVVSV